MNNLQLETLKQLEYKAVLETISRYCYTEIGKETLLTTIPQENLLWLRNEHDMVWEMTELLIKEGTIPIENLSDIRSLLQKSLVQNAVLSTSEILKICDGIRVSRLLKNFFNTLKEKYPKLAEETSELYENRLLEKHISDAIDDTGTVKDNASKELLRIRKEINEKSVRLRNRLQKIMKNISENEMLTDEFYTLREGRFVLPIKVEHKRHIPGIIHSVSQTGQTVFLEPSEIIDMNNELSLLQNEEKREIYRILSNLTSEIGYEANQILYTLETIAHIDRLMAKGKYALEYGGIKPEIIETNEIYLSKLYHPLLVHAKTKKNVVPLTIEFSEEKRGHLISGPNAGGKTVALKSIGLNIAMALSGIFPLGECRTNIRTIYTSIGDHQSIENDLSTFSSQIIQIRDILSYHNSDSLVLIDEICSGTDPQEGSALAAGILDTFIETKAFFVATTHQSSLKSYALNRKEIENDSLEFDEKELKPTYKFLQGIPGNSYAFFLAKNLGLSELVLKRARQYLDTKQTELEESIKQLQRFRAEAEELKIEAEQSKLIAEKYKKDYEIKFKEIKEKKKELISNARNEAYEIVSKANALVENTIREIKEKQKDLNIIRKDFQIEKKEIEKKLQEIEKDKLLDKTTEEEFNIGDAIRTEDSNEVGTILEIDKKSKIAIVEFNDLKFKIHLNKLIKAEQKPTVNYKLSELYNFSIKSSLDIRGKRVDEALMELESYISQAILANLSQLTIIHGKGTGALREAIHNYLKEHSSVSSFRIGTLIEGGAGVTVVELK